MPKKKVTTKKKLKQGHCKVFTQDYDLLRNIIDQIADNVMVTDKQGNIEYVNSAFEHTTGYAIKEVIGENPRFLKSGYHGIDFYEQLWNAILAGKTFKAQTVNKNKKGELYISDQTISPIHNDEGDITNFVSVWNDVTMRVRAEEKLKNLKDKCELEKRKLEQVLNIEEHLNTIFDLNKLIDFVVNNTTKVLEADKCSVMFVDDNGGELCIKGHKGLKDEHIRNSRIKLGDPIAGVVALEGKPVLVKDIEKDKRFVRTCRPSYNSKSFISAPIKLGDTLIGVISVTDKNNKEREFSELDLKILCMIVRQAAIAIENAKIYRQLNYLTVTDPITNMHNYRYFVQKLDYEIARIKRYPRSLCLLMIDVDGFKKYNDKYGHLEGDHLLRMVGNVLEKILRNVDVACRYAGDEFVVILPETDVEQAHLVAKKIKKKFETLGGKRKTSISIGLAKYGGKMDRSELILKADTALYHAKKEGKNRVVIAE